VAEFAWPHLNNAATELRRLAGVEAEWAELSQDTGKADGEIDRLRAEVSQLRADANTCGSGAGCCYQAAQNERLDAELQQARTELAALRASLGEPVGFASDLDRPSPRFVTDLKFCTIAEHEAGDHIKYIPLYAIKDAMLSASPQAPDHTEDVLGMVAQPAEHALKPINDADFPAEDEAKLSPDPYTSFVYGARWAEHTHGIRHTQAPQPTQPDPWAEYLKEGETPFERFMRERADLVALLGLHEKTLAKVAQPNTDQQP